MDNVDIKEEIYTIDNRKFKVFTRVANEKLSKESLIKLIVNYGMDELNTVDL